MALAEVTAARWPLRFGSSAARRRGNASQWFPQDAQPWLDDLLEREDMVPVLVHPLEVVPNAALKLVCDVGVAGVRAKQEHCGRFQRRNTYMHAIHCFLKTQKCVPDLVVHQALREQAHQHRRGSVAAA